MIGRAIQRLELEKRNLKLFFGVLIGLCLFFTISYMGRLVERMQIEAQAAEWEQRIEDAHVRQAELQAQLAFVTSQSYVEEVARKEFGYALPGDSVVIVVPESGESLPQNQMADASVESATQIAATEPIAHAQPVYPSRMRRWMTSLVNLFQE